MKILLQTLIFFFGIISFCYGHAAQKELSLINDNFKKWPNLTVNITYNSYASHSHVAPLESSLGSFKKSGTNYMLEMEGLKSIKTEECFLVIDPYEKQMIVSVAPETTNIPGPEFLEKLLQEKVKAEIVKVDAKTNRIILKMEDPALLPDFSSVEVFYDNRSHFIQKLVLFYADVQDLTAEGAVKPDKPRMEIVYSNWNTKGIFQENEFTINQYFKESEGKISGNGQYANYQLLDHRPPTPTKKKKK